MPLRNRLAMKIWDCNTPGSCLNENTVIYAHLAHLSIASLLRKRIVCSVRICLFKAHPVMEGHHEVRKSLSLWHLSKK